jgi:hypothetical protein
MAMALRAKMVVLGAPLDGAYIRVRRITLSRLGAQAECEVIASEAVAKPAPKAKAEGEAVPSRGDSVPVMTGFSLTLEGEDFNPEVNQFAAVYAKAKEILARDFDAQEIADA